MRPSRHSRRWAPREPARRPRSERERRRELRPHVRHRRPTPHRHRCSLHRARPIRYTPVRAGRSLTAPWGVLPSVSWLSNAWVRGVAFAVLFLGVLVGSRGFYGVLRGPAQATESILRDAARLAGYRGGLSLPAPHGQVPGLPDLGSLERFSRLWATTPRRMTDHIAPTEPALPEPAKTPKRSRIPPGMKKVTWRCPTRAS